MVFHTPGARVRDPGLRLCNRFAVNNAAWFFIPRVRGYALSWVRCSSMAELRTLIGMSTPQTYILLSASALAAGIINSLAGGGTLLTFSSLVPVLGPVMANATCTVALLP